MDTVTKTQGGKGKFIVGGIIVLALIAWGIYYFVSSVYSYQAQEMSWRTAATNYINQLVSFDQQLIASQASSTKK